MSIKTGFSFFSAGRRFSFFVVLTVQPEGNKGRFQSRQKTSPTRYRCRFHAYQQVLMSCRDCMRRRFLCAYICGLKREARIYTAEAEAASKIEKHSCSPFSFLQCSVGYLSVQQCVVYGAFKVSHHSRCHRHYLLFIQIAWLAVQQQSIYKSCFWVF